MAFHRLADNLQDIREHQLCTFSDIEEVNQGFNLKLSNRAIMNSIQSFLSSKYSFIIKNSKKLIGKNPNTGGDLYRSYLLLRLIPFQVNSYIQIKNVKYLVKKIHANRIILENFNTKMQRTRNFEFFEKNLVELLEV